MPAHKKCDDEKKDYYITIRGNKLDVESWENAAKEINTPTSKWCRTWLNWIIANHDWLMKNGH